jgi:hypothetical protein
LEAFAQLVNLATAELAANGWKTLRCQVVESAPWHIAVCKGASWRVIQILTPASSAEQRQASRRALGLAAQLPGKMGSMEQWLAHVRPGGRVVFGVDHLSSTAWSTGGSEVGIRERLGIKAASADGEVSS